MTKERISMKGITAICFFTVIMFVALVPKTLMPKVYALDATVSVNPTLSTPTLGQIFNLTIEVQDVTNLSSWQLELFFDPTLLNCTNFTVPLDNIFGADIISPPPIINNTSGRLFAYTALDAEGSVNGSGILCRIEFQTKIPGISFIDIRNEVNYSGTYLADPASNLIQFTAVDGTVKIAAPSFQESAYQVTVNSTVYTFIIYSNSTIANFNYFTNETVKYTATAADGTKGQTTAIIPKALLRPPPATLTNGTATYSTFSENATHVFVHYTYNHSAKEITILSTILYDVNGDRIVNMVDLYLVALHFGEMPGFPKWNPLVDVDHNGIINMLDMYRVAVHFGDIWTP
jgi:hypothetical protein